MQFNGIMSKINSIHPNGPYKDKNIGEKDLS